ncbi:hypothetical protein JHN59_08540 [Streptomyces sp. MBT49]|uniref:hypothetical protein n=1 Tax=unclassified Streptomyces TaxID=2593676 RepID=UPI0019098A7E|nr:MULTISPECIES: hypothetical protein [unclassified Streptomyces]MBK3624894.1 hypothetical protein [Streptomyces sp. MBT49]MBK3632538.1 hypothetical protein [Streptomyces sp. MBT97]
MSGIVHARPERELVARGWLLLSAEDLSKARDDWAQQSIALLRCGVLFDLVRVRSEIVTAAAGTTDQEGVAQFLADGVRGPVFADRYSGLYYCLVPPGTRKGWVSCDAACLGLGCHVGVPRPGLDAADGAARCYWAVPMAAPGDMCSPAAVQQLVHIGRYRQLEAGRGGLTDA